MTVAMRSAGVWRLMHPGPSLATAGVFGICAVIASGGRPEPIRFITSIIGLICMQFAISALNDYCDRASDAFSHKRKPIVEGIVTPQFALVATVVLTIGMYLCFLPWGIGPTITASVFLGLGFAYDLGVKSTPFSGVMHGLAFPTLPLLAWQLFSHPFPALYWTFALGMALGLGIHLADAIPDMQADHAAGANGLAQYLGSLTVPVCWSLFALADILVAVIAITQVVMVRPLLIVGTVVIGLALLARAILIWQQQSLTTKQRLRGHFLWLLGSAVATTVGWLSATIMS